MMTYKIGLTQAGLTELSALAVPLPRPYSTYQPHTEIVNTVDGGAIGLGFPTVTWQFVGLSLQQRDQLRQYCQGVAAHVYIETPGVDNQDAARQLYCVMLWPLAEVSAASAGRRETLTIEFRVLQDVTP